MRARWCRTCERLNLLLNEERFTYRTYVYIYFFFVDAEDTPHRWGIKDEGCLGNRPLPSWDVLRYVLDVI